MLNPHLRSGFAGFISIVLAGLPLHSFASTFLQLDVPALSQRSEMVVQGRVTHIESAWDETKSMVYTYVTVDVSRTLKGFPQQTIEVRVPGGKVGGLTVRAVGTAHFHLNQEVLAFISRWSDGTPRVTGYQQGLSHVVRDIQGNMRLRGGAANGTTVSQLARQLNPERGAQP